LERARMHLVELVRKELVEALVRAPHSRVRHTRELVYRHNVVRIGHDRQRLDERC
jgi:hypothetical protein